MKFKTGECQYTAEDTPVSVVWAQEKKIVSSERIQKKMNRKANLRTNKMQEKRSIEKKWQKGNNDVGMPEFFW